MNQSQRRRTPHSREYVRRLLQAASKADPERYSRASQLLRGKVLHVVVETAVDEDLYLFGEDGNKIRLRARATGGAPDLMVRISPGALRRILEGQETPVEAFLLGNLRARGATKDLYMLHALFIAIAEIAVTSPEIHEIIEDFQAAKQDL